MEWKSKIQTFKIVGLLTEEIYSKRLLFSQEVYYNMYSYKIQLGRYG